MNHQCRFCDKLLTNTFCDLGETPPSNSYLKRHDQEEEFFPLHAYVCSHCLLVQLGQFQTPDEIFSDYAYFSSYSETWVKHAKDYTDLVTNRLSLNNNNLVIEIASNDGYLLQHFKEKGIPILGVEPAKNVAEIAQEKGIPSLVKFFGIQTAKELVAEGKKADLLIGNNVLAHVPDLNDFVAGFKIILADEGVVTLEFPHLLQLIKHNQFDTIYHEHFSYFSLLCLEKVFQKHGLEIFDVDELSTHGGSLRVYLQHLGEGQRDKEGNVAKVLSDERAYGLDQLAAYATFYQRTQELKKNLVAFLQKAKKEGKTIVGYGAPAKGNTLLNYCEIGPDLLPFTVDLSPHKQGCFLPGSRIPIYSPQKIFDIKPDYVLILPWNLKKEIMDQMAQVREWGGQFVTPIPEVTVGVGK